MNRVSLPLLLLLAGASLAQARTVTVLLRSDRQSVDVEVGDRLRVVLGVQSGTGYRWDLREDARDVVDLVRSDRYPVSSGDMPGSRASQTFEFRVTDRGRDRMSFALMPPGNRRPEQTSVLNVNVRGGGRPDPEDETTYDDGDNGSRVRLRPGDTFVVKLKSNMSTGYSWKLLDSTPTGLELIEGPRYVGPRPNPLQPGLGQMVGVGGHTWYRFRVKGRGWATNRNALAFRYMRGNSSAGSQRWVLYYTIER